MKLSDKEDTFKKLCNFDVKETHTHGIELRQDKISGGIVSATNEIDLLIKKVEMGSNAYLSFDLKFENNMHKNVFNKMFSICTNK